MEDNRDDLVVIGAGYEERMAHSFHRIRTEVTINKHYDFPDYSAEESCQISQAISLQGAIYALCDPPGNVQELPRRNPF